jgi:hypothetical protein
VDAPSGFISCLIFTARARARAPLQSAKALPHVRPTTCVLAPSRAAASPWWGWLDRGTSSAVRCRRVAVVVDLGVAFFCSVTMGAMGLYTCPCKVRGLSLFFFSLAFAVRAFPPGGGPRDEVVDSLNRLVRIPTSCRSVRQGPRRMNVVRKLRGPWPVWIQLSFVTGRPLGQCASQVPLRTGTAMQIVSLQCVKRSGMSEYMELAFGVKRHLLFLEAW